MPMRSFIEKASLWKIESYLVYSTEPLAMLKTDLSGERLLFGV